MTRVVEASEFKAKCLALLDEVGRTRESLTITKKGKPVADLVPYRAPNRNARGILKDTLFIKGDIISPIDVEWEALHNPSRSMRLINQGNKSRYKKAKSHR